MSRILLLLACLLWLGGCSTIDRIFSGKADPDAPAELVKLQNELAIEVLWSIDVGDGSEGQALRLSPLIIGEAIYTVDRDGLVTAVELASGSRLWKQKTKTSVTSGPGGNQDLLLLGTDQAELLALNRVDGSLLWRVPVSSEILSIPQVVDGVVVAQTTDGKLIGLDAMTGTKRWTYSRTVPKLTLRGTSSPYVLDDQIIAGFANGTVSAIDVQSGKANWEVTIANASGRSELERMTDIDTDPVLAADGTLFVAAYQHHVAAVETGAGTVLWRKDLSTYSGFGLDWTQLYVSDEKSYVWALDPDNGAALWKQDRLLNRQLTAPVVFRENVVVGDLEGYLHWLSTEDGHLMARVRLDRQAIGVPPIVVDEILYVLSQGGELTALRTVPESTEE